MDHARIYFKNKTDCKYKWAWINVIDLFLYDLVIKVAQSIIFEKTLKIGQKKLHMILQK